MKPIRFEWDRNKNIDNKRKHGVSFEEAQAVFLDENALMIHDPDHSEDEDRFCSSWFKCQDPFIGRMSLLSKKR